MTHNTLKKSLLLLLKILLFPFFLFHIIFNMVFKMMVGLYCKICWLAVVLCIINAIVGFRKTGALSHNDLLILLIGAIAVAMYFILPLLCIPLELNEDSMRSFIYGKHKGEE